MPRRKPKVPETLGFLLGKFVEFPSNFHPLPGKSHLNRPNNKKTARFKSGTALQSNIDDLIIDIDGNSIILYRLASGCQWGSRIRLTNAPPTMAGSWGDVTSYARFSSSF